MAPETFKVDDKVSWNHTQAKVTGTAANKPGAPMDTKTHPAATSPERLQRLVKSTAFRPVAAHKLSTLKRVNAK